MSGDAPGGLRKRSVMIAGHRTSVSLEAAFWEALREVAAARGQSMPALIGAIDADRGGQNLSSAIRVFVLHAMREQALSPPRGRGPAERAGAGPAQIQPERVLPPTDPY